MRSFDEYDGKALSSFNTGFGFMRICALVKYPPIQGGVSAQSYWICRRLAERGHQVFVVTNAEEVESEFKIWLTEDDRPFLEPRFANGGGVFLSSTYANSRMKYIPYANPYVTKLAAIATEQIRRFKCDVIFSYYLEPYGVSAFLASTWTNLPHVARHAGSDAGRLMIQPELALVYREVLRRVAYLISTNENPWVAIGVPPDRISRKIPHHLPREYFHPSAKPLDVNGLLARLVSEHHPVIFNAEQVDLTLPTIGVYGKIGSVKGSYDLVHALAKLKQEGLKFNFLVLGGGTGDRVRFLRAVTEAGLRENTWTLPFLPHWRVPEFIRACTTVCMLERRFPIVGHSPSVPSEVLACGTCLIVSDEVARKQKLVDELAHEKNALIVNDPFDTAELASVLRTIVCNPEHARAIGVNGSSLVPREEPSEFAIFFERIFQQATAPVSQQRPLGHKESISWLGLAAKSLPGTAIVLGEQLQSALASFPLEVLGGQESSKSVLALSEHLCERIAAEGRTLVPGALEVALFEQYSRWLRTDIEAELGLPPFELKHAKSNPEASGAVESKRPIRSNYIRLLTLSFDVPEFMDRVRLGESPTQLHPYPEQVTLLFFKRPNMVSRRFRISAKTQRFLELCDGTRTIAEIALMADGARRRFDVDKIQALIGGLTREGLIRLV